MPSPAKKKEKPSLDGIADWIKENGGTVEPFNDHIDLGMIRGYRYRLFKAEGWIGLKTPLCPAGMALSFESTAEFIDAINTLTASAAPQTQDC